MPSYFIDTKETSEHWAQYYSDITVWPHKIKAKSRSNALVSWVDIFPTLLDIIDAEEAFNLDGKSFKKVLTGKSENHRSYIFTTHSGDGNMNVYPIRSIRNKRFKYILNLHPEYYHSNHSDILRKANAGAYWDSWDKAAKTDENAAKLIQKYHVRPGEEFYDIVNDPFEQTNLILSEDFRDEIIKMQELLNEWMKEQGDAEHVFGTPYPVSGPIPYSIHSNTSK